MASDAKKVVNESENEYQLAEDAHLKKVLQTSYTERFHAMTRLMKLGMLLKSETIVHKKIE